jgi:hypothetical protein
LKIENPQLEVFGLRALSQSDGGLLQFGFFGNFGIFGNWPDPLGS